MAPEAEDHLTFEEFKLLTDRAGLGMSTEEVEDLKPLYEMYLQLIGPLRSLDLKAEEIGMAFRPDWPAPTAPDHRSPGPHCGAGFRSS